MKFGLALFLSLSCLQSALALAQPVQIVAIGDSNIAGKGVAEKDAYPAKLERALRADGYDVRVANAGFIGDTTQGVLRRLDSDVPLGTRIAVVWVGINDLRMGADQAQVEADRQRIAMQLRNRGIEVLLLGPTTGLGDQRQYQVGDRQGHLNSAGYDVVVSRTLPEVEELLKQLPKAR